MFSKNQMQNDRQGRLSASVFRLCGLAWMIFAIALSGSGDVFGQCTPGLDVGGVNDISATFVGNTNAAFHIQLPSCIQTYEDCSAADISQVTVFRNGQEIAKVGTGWNQNGYTFEDTGLVKGATYTYSIQGNCGTYFSQEVTVTAGKVSGVLPHDMIWEGEWTLNGDLFAGGVYLGKYTLTIQSGAVADGKLSTYANSYISTGEKGTLIIDGATIRNLNLSGSPYGGTLTILNSTLENVFIPNPNNFTLESNTLNGVDIRDVHNYLNHESFATNRGNNVRLLFANRQGLTDVNFSGIQNISGFSLDLNMAVPPASITISNNKGLDAFSVQSQEMTTVYAYGNVFSYFGTGIRITGAGGAIIQGNDGGGISLKDIPSVSAKTSVRMNRNMKGIYLENVDNAVVEGNEAAQSSNGYGLWLKKGKNNIIRNNRFVSSLMYSDLPDVGICLGFGPGAGEIANNQVLRNQIVGFNKGIGLCGNDNLITGNIVRDSRFPINVGGLDGMITEVSGNRIYDNMFIGQNWGKIFCTSCTSVWNMNKTGGPNIVGGPLQGGNYWSVYTEEDRNKDGFIDIPFQLNDHNTDYLPLPAPLIVNETSDEEDADAADNRCDTDLESYGDQCTLRAAIQTANYRTGDDTIIFITPLIQVQKPLPAVTGKVIINGLTQPGVKINGASAVKIGREGDETVNGLEFYAECELKGLTVKQFSGHGIYADSPLVMEGVSVKDNKKWGVYAKSDLKVNESKLYTGFMDNNGTEGKEGGGMFSERTLTAYKCDVTNNKGPGIAAMKDITGNGLKITANKGPGIQSLQGKILLKDSDEFGTEQIIGNEGPGIMTGEDMMLPSTGDGMGGFPEQDIEIQRPAEIRSNGGWGILATHAAVYLNTPPSSLLLYYHRDTSYITGNGDTAKPCRYLTADGTGVRLVQPEAEYHAGGIGARSDIKVSFAESSDNNGCGIVSNGNVYLRRIKVSNNKGPGIVSRLGEIYIYYLTAGAAEGNEVIGNEGAGIMTGENMLFSESGGADADITINTDIQVRNNAGWGIFSRQGLYVNSNTTLEGTVSTFPVSPATSSVTGNGDRLKPCWMVDSNGQLELLDNPHAIMGGMAAKTCILGNRLDVSDNHGPGVLSLQDVHLRYVKANNNKKGPGIQSYLGEIRIMRSDDAQDNQVIGNSGAGILSGTDFVMNSTGKGIFIEAGIQVSSNAGWGIFSAAGSVYVNALEGVSGPITNATGYITGNGDRTKPCWMVTDDSGLVELLDNPYAVMGGIGAKSTITANRLEVTDNKGNGVLTKANLQMNTGRICNNTAGDMAVSGTVTLTEVETCDTDNDGVSDAAEDLGPNIGDANHDGIADKEQPGVAFIQAGTLECHDPDVRLTNAYYVNLNGAKERFVGFTLTSVPSRGKSARNLTPGGTSTVTFWLPEDITPANYLAYGPTTDNVQPHWYEFLFDGDTGAESADGKVILHLRDGGRGDNDLLANGVIVHEGHHVIAGDFTDNGTAGLDDVIAVLKVLAGIDIQIINVELTGDDKIGSEDAVFLLQDIGELR